MMASAFVKSLLRNSLSRAYEVDLARRGVSLGAGAYISGRPIITRYPGSSLSIGDRFVAESVPRRQVIGVSHAVILRTLAPTAVLTIGNDCGLSGATVVATCSITIGDGALLGADCMIIDTDFHPVDHTERRYAARPVSGEEDAVRIGTNVFIGARATVLRGVDLGDNCVVAAGSIVTRSFPANSVIAGSPARLIRTVVLPSSVN